MVECPASAVVLGSAVHNRRWLPGASAFVRDHAGVLADRPVWLFSVSSVGDFGSFLAPPVARVMRRARGESKEHRRAPHPRGRPGPPQLRRRDRTWALVDRRARVLPAGRRHLRRSPAVGRHRPVDRPHRHRVLAERRMNRHVGFPDRAGSASAASGPKRPPGESPPGGPSWPATASRSVGGSVALASARLVSRSVRPRTRDLGPTGARRGAPSDGTGRTRGRGRIGVLAMRAIGQAAPVRGGSMSRRGELR